MFPTNTLFWAILLASLMFVTCKCQSLEIMAVGKDFVSSKPAEAAFLTQLNFTKSVAGDAIYTYKCTVGTPVSNRLGCSNRDSTSWTSPHNVELKLRCPARGSGLKVSYVEIIYSVSSNSVNCFVHEGAVSLGYIGITVNVWNTVLFSYSADFYTY